jgi:phage shock protein C
MPKKRGTMKAGKATALREGSKASSVNDARSRRSLIGRAAHANVASRRSLIGRAAHANVASRRSQSGMEQRLEDFGEEMEALGDRMGRRLDERRGSCGWCCGTFGPVWPFLSSVLGIAFIALLLWFMDFFNVRVGSGFLAGVGNFVQSSLGLFFLIFLFFSYSSYVSRCWPRQYRAASPIVTAAGIVVALWLAASAIGLSALPAGMPFLSGAAGFVMENLVWLFMFFLVLGYLVLAVARATGFRGAHETREERRSAIRARRESLRAARLEGAARTPGGDAGVKRLYRSGEDRILGGVCGGIAEYLGVDPVIIRLLWVAGTLAWGFGILLYIIFWIVVPRNPKHKWK